jgi:hypothetical protein
MMAISAEAEVQQNEKYLQASIQQMIELLQEKDLTDIAFFNAYIVQAEDIRRFANNVMGAKRVCEALKVAMGE